MTLEKTAEFSVQRDNLSSFFDRTKISVVQFGKWEEQIKERNDFTVDSYVLIYHAKGESNII